MEEVKRGEGEEEVGIRQGNPTRYKLFKCRRCVREWQFEPEMSEREKRRESKETKGRRGRGEGGTKVG